MRPQIIIKCPELLGSHGSVLSYIINDYRLNHYSMFGTGRDNQRRHVLQYVNCNGCREITVLLHHTERSIIVETAKQRCKQQEVAQKSNEEY